MRHVVLVLKTNEGGLWAVPQIEELRTRGARVTVVIPEGDGRLRRLLDRRRIEVIDSAFDFSFRPSLRLGRQLIALRRQLRELQPDVVFYHLYASALAARIATLGRKVRRVHMVAGPLYLDSRPIRWAERLLCGLDTVVIGGSEHTAERYRALGMPEDRVVGIPYGVDLERYSKSAVKRHAIYDPTKFTAIMVAYVYAPKSSVYPGVGIKGHEILLEAWKQFVTDHPSSRLIFVGAGFDAAGEKHRQDLMSRWSNVLSKTVQWIDSVPDVRGWYAAADISISPSLSENHGAALEASAMECPSIVSTAGALPEAVIAGETGWIIPAGDVQHTLEALTTAAAAWEAESLAGMGQSARELMKDRFDQKRCTERVADVVLGEAF
jgi:glycosyltransferase involved in cell wall biosynthesis